MEEDIEELSSVTKTKVELNKSSRKSLLQYEYKVATILEKMFPGVAKAVILLSQGWQLPPHDYGPELALDVFASKHTILSLHSPIDNADSSHGLW